MFNSVAIIGLGLIGGSFAKLIKKYAPQTIVVAYDSTPSTLELAHYDGVLDGTLTQAVDKALANADLIVLATHLNASCELLEKIHQHFAGKLIIDLGSVKAPICAEAERLKARFMGGHPMAGKELSGYQHSDAALFENKRFILTPPAKADEDDVKALQTWLKTLSFKVSVMPATAHDELMALVSHFPQAYALVLGRLLNHKAEQLGVDPLVFAGGGLHDHIRLMGSNPEMWNDVFEQNQQAMRQILAEVVAEMQAFSTHLAPSQLEDWFIKSSNIYSRFKSNG